MMEEFVVHNSERRILDSYKSKIEKLFDVCLGLDPDQGYGSGGLLGDNNVGHDMWVQITHSSGSNNRENIQKAKNYVLSLCEKQHIQIVSFPPELKERILNRIEDFERECSAVISHIPGDFKLKIWAWDDLSLLTACSLVEKEILSEQISKTITTSSIKPNCINENCCSHVVDESTDSHYEPITRSGGGSSTKSLTCTTCTTDRNLAPTTIDSLFQTPNGNDGQTDVLKKYSDMLDFVLKLGYSQEQLDQVLPQLGKGADRNDVLGALERNSSTPAELDRNALIPHCADVGDSPPHVDDVDNLRAIIIDGSNVAMSFGRKDVFECRGIKIVVDWFKKRCHSTIIVFIPEWRKESSKPNTLIEDQHLMLELEREGILVFTPSRRVNGMRKTCYDDRYIVKTAVDLDGIIVSKDNFRDLQNESLEWKKFISERLLLYAFVTDKFMPPDDPLGRNGPSLENFLQIRPTQIEPLTHCPYGAKCTFGNKCKYFHADRPRYKSVADSLKDNHNFRAKSKSPVGSAEKFDPKPSSYTAPALSRRDDISQSASYSSPRLTDTPLPSSQNATQQYPSNKERNGHANTEPVRYISNNRPHTVPFQSSHAKKYAQSRTEPLAPGYTKRPAVPSLQPDYQQPLTNEMNRMHIRSQGTDIAANFIPVTYTRRPSYPGYASNVSATSYSSPYVVQSGRYYHDIANHYDHYPQRTSEGTLHPKGIDGYYAHHVNYPQENWPYVASAAPKYSTQPLPMSSNLPASATIATGSRHQDKSDEFQEKRRNMKHHLSALFGEKAVERAMLKLPDTTDPSQIVAAM